MEKRDNNKKQEKIRRNRTDQKGKKTRKLSNQELRILAYIATLVLAGIALYRGTELPAFWTFLGVALGSLFGNIIAVKN